MEPATFDPETFFQLNPLRSFLPIPAEVLEQARATAYQLYRARRYRDAETMCRGLLAADPTHWWIYTLYAATLQKLGCLREALTIAGLGLRHASTQPKLLAIRNELHARLETIAAAAGRIAAAEQGRATTPNEGSV